MNSDVSINKTESIGVKLQIEPLNTSWCLEKSLPEYNFVGGRGGKYSMQEQLIADDMKQNWIFELLLGMCATEILIKILSY